MPTKAIIFVDQRIRTFPLSKKSLFTKRPRPDLRFNIGRPAFTLDARAASSMGHYAGTLLRAAIGAIGTTFAIR